MKSLVYSAVIIGPHSSVFFTAITSSANVTVSHLELKHDGVHLLYLIQIAGKSSKMIDIHFCGNAISDFEAMLFLVGRLGGIACGSTLSFALRGSVTGAEPEVTHVLTEAVHHYLCNTFCRSRQK